jgi:hypothetical protein
LNPEIAQYFATRQRRLSVVRTTRTPSGQTLDWVPVESQAMHGPIASPPPPHKHVPAVDEHRDIAHRPSETATFELHDIGADRGPAGTVPILRKNLAALHETTSLRHYLAKKQRPRPSDPAPLVPGPTFYHCRSTQVINCVGCLSWLNIWQPYVDGSNDHSLMQLGLSNVKDSVLQSLEAGWTCDQSLNGDWAPHLFTFYTTNDYLQEGDFIGGYNTDVDGWVQVSSSIFPGAAFGGVSTAGGPQIGLAIYFLVYENNWWLWVQNNPNGDGEWIGYYPSWLFFGQPGDSLFTTLGAEAAQVGFWGEVGTASSDPDQDTTQMGSGARAEAGWRQACFQKNLSVQLSPDTGLLPQLGVAHADDSARYDIALVSNSGGSWGTYFFAGG